MYPPTHFSFHEEYRLFLRDAFRDVLTEELEPLRAELRALKGNPSSEYLSTEETLRLLHISKPTLHKLRGKGLVECFHSSDSRVIYKRSQLEEYLKSQKRK